MEAIGTLAGGIAHDFNNLLMGILGYTSLILLHTDKDDSHYEKLKAIESQVQSGTELTRQILGFARGGRRFAAPLGGLLHRRFRNQERQPHSGSRLGDGREDGRIGERPGGIPLSQE